MARRASFRRGSGTCSTSSRSALSSCRCWSSGEGRSIPGWCLPSAYLRCSSLRVSFCTCVAVRSGCSSATRSSCPSSACSGSCNGLPNLSENAKAAGVRVTSPVPIVFIQLDEMAASSLMTRDGAIDAVRYPNFARLSRDGVWYRNATTVHEWTSDAVPSILSGQIGKPYGVPTLQHHPDNLFTLLGGDYTFHVHENITRLCPRTYCPRATPSTLANGYGLFADSFSLLVPRVFPRSVSGRVIGVVLGHLRGERSVGSPRAERARARDHAGEEGRRSHVRPPRSAARPVEVLSLRH